MLILLCFQHVDKSEMLYGREDDIAKSLSTRMIILGEEEGFSQDTLLAKDLELSDSGRYYCVSTGITRTGEEEGAVCYDVIVVPRASGKGPPARAQFQATIKCYGLRHICARFQLYMRNGQLNGKSGERRTARATGSE